jgi:hypothetical protein
MLTANEKCLRRAELDSTVTLQITNPNKKHKSSDWHVCPPCKNAILSSVFLYFVTQLLYLFNC